MNDLFGSLTEDSAYGTVPRPVARAAYRSSDPPSSREAAKAHDRSGRTNSHEIAVLALVRKYPGSTGPELHAAQGMNGAIGFNEIYRRLNGLGKERMANGLTPLVRKGPPRTCGIKNRDLVTWWPVEEEAT